ncbi:MAG: MGMT family protein [Candidatus Woesearchaeota archaeon]
MKDKKFTTKCYELLMLIPLGRVTTYSEIAKKLETRAHRAVGRAMKENKNAPRVPCHRVVKSNGDVGEYNLGRAEKIKILTKEGIKIKDNKILNFKEKLYKF